ncbi:hypothetical protein KL908_004165 [Ogataea polymorpha]|nr:hypothetical protein KL908_004165 [Ogataea polymorpha]
MHRCPKTKKQPDLEKKTPDTLIKTNALVFSSDITLPAGQSHIASQKIEYRHPDDTSDLDPPQPDRYNGISKSGFLTFGHLPAEAHCFDPDMMSELEVDIAILGAPFDTRISYNPGSRFGPDAIRQGTRKYSAVFSPYKEGFLTHGTVGPKLLTAVMLQ